MEHIPVLLTEVLAGLNLRSGLTVVDCTLGGGGHAAAIARSVGARGRVIAFDQDPCAREYARQALTQNTNIELIQENFCSLAGALAARQINSADGFLFDLGVSSFQLDDPARGFSWRQDCALDMRMDPANPLTAAEIVNQYSQTALADIIYQYGEERQARRVARNICLARAKTQITSSGQLKAIILRSVSGSYAARTAAISRVFQALRIAVNQELAILDAALSAAAGLLRPGGRIAVISFHSLEDRIVKNTFRRLKTQGVLELVAKKPLTAGAAERENNPRARSAKLRLGAKNAG
ncbi:MAG: 16S rRNA (cytosine(1402)-N(4))-methyltransferase RsmH [Candidatus Margulisbacteria bacterium]|jgi:16S rRNA (cytosine1402-N4)-methyltransferase|nr:16S rRNA (cytosine(1402)-N(4))-methyltransferase RsmH [Candidatus Margulisiibacteriota bacterium]